MFEDFSKIFQTLIEKRHIFLCIIQLERVSEVSKRNAEDKKFLSLNKKNLIIFIAFDTRNKNKKRPLHLK